MVHDMSSGNSNATDGVCMSLRAPSAVFAPRDWPDCGLKATRCHDGLWFLEAQANASTPPTASSMDKASTSCPCCDCAVYPSSGWSSDGASAIA